MPRGKYPCAGLGGRVPENPMQLGEPASDFESLRLGVRHAKNSRAAQSVNREVGPKPLFRHCLLGQRLHVGQIERHQRFQRRSRDRRAD